MKSGNYKALNEKREEMSQILNIQSNNNKIQSYRIDE